MSASSPTETRDRMLRPENLLVYRTRWCPFPGVHPATARSLAEQGVTAAYAAAGLSPPAQIIWCRSPMEIERSRRANWYACSPGAAVKHRIADDVVRSVAASARLTLPENLDVDVARALSSPSSSLAAARSVSAIVSQAVENVRWPLGTIFTDAVRRFQRKPTTAFTGFEQASWGQLELREILGTYEYLHDHFGPLPDTVRLRGLWALALNAGWVVPHENVCWLSERCTDLAVDAQGRLHSGFGPALSFADGWKYYSWKGVAIPDWVVEKRAALTVQAIDRVLDPIVRRCMIEIMTPERYVTEGGARCIATDAVGKLWQSRWGLDIWNVVEVVNGTPEPDGTTRRYYLQVPPEVGTPIEAVAWTYGLNTERYATLKLRT